MRSAVPQAMHPMNSLMRQIGSFHQTSGIIRVSVLHLPCNDAAIKKRHATAVLRNRRPPSPIPDTILSPFPEQRSGHRQNRRCWSIGSLQDVAIRLLWPAFPHVVLRTPLPGPPHILMITMGGWMMCNLSFNPAHASLEFIIG